MYTAEHKPPRGDRLVDHQRSEVLACGEARAGLDSQPDAPAATCEAPQSQQPHEHDGEAHDDSGCAQPVDERARQYRPVEF